MKKDQLKLGMVVETRNKNRYLLVLINDMRVFINKNYFCQRLENYFSDLYYESDSNFDIMKVYQIDVFNSLDDIDDDVMLKLLWERKEPVEITMEQIAEKFGLPVDMIKIKKPKE